MTNKLVSRYDTYLMACNGALVSRDPDALDACERVCPGCYDDGADVLLDNAEKLEAGGTWAFTSTTATWTWQAHEDCDGELGAFAGMLWACVCVPTGHTLRIDVAGDRRVAGLNPPGLKHAVYIDNEDPPSIVITTQMPGSGPPCLLSQDADYGVLTAGLYCIFILSHSNGDNFDAGSVVYTLTPDGT